ncbi:hypothetical protein BTHERMOSOX_522 [Bathymodiolus thermophilus thioautotrophic gill symbiont]|nr:hypothetical protein BTHERMOSOX_522 [Bathymodiolus thermophilus thioautotrophic gill symbiont]
MSVLKSAFFCLLLNDTFWKNIFGAILTSVLAEEAVAD